MPGAFDAANILSYLLVFLEGVLSFFSPCVLPLLPIYISYLAGNAKQTDDQGNVTYKQKKVFFHTVCFVLGISFAFFLLGLSFTAFGRFFSGHREIFSRIAGLIILLLGLYQVGLFRVGFLSREHKIHTKFNLKKMNPLVAFLLGFTFSFAWTPCVGPALSSVLLMASSSENALAGNLLVLLYTVGFVLPFLALGLFTTAVLNFIKKRQKVLQYAIKVGGVILILIGLLTVMGWMDTITGRLFSLGGGAAGTVTSQTAETEESSSTAPASSAAATPSAGASAAGTAGQTSSGEDEADTRPDAPDFTLQDQYGNTHTLSDYKGKVVFLNFWATWCGPCRSEMPDIEALYKEYGENTGDVIFLGVAGPGGQEQDQAGIEDFIAENGYTFPTVFDTTGQVQYNYYISAFPTTFMIDAEGKVYGYVPGAMDEETMREIIRQTQAGQGG